MSKSLAQIDKEMMQHIHRKSYRTPTGTRKHDRDYTNYIVATLTSKKDGVRHGKKFLRVGPMFGEVK